MTPQQVIGLGLRICSLWLAFNSITFLYSLPRAVSQNELMTAHVGWSYAVGIVYLIVPALIWIFPMAIAHALVPRKSCVAQMADPAFALARVGIVLFGVMMFAVAGTDLVRHVLITVFNQNMGIGLVELPANWIMQGVADVAAIAFGLALIFGSSVLASTISRQPASPFNADGDIDTQDDHA